MRIPNAWTAGLVLACVAAVGASSDASPRAISGAAAERSGDSPPTQIGRTHPYFLRKVREILTPPEEGTAPVQEELVAELVALGPESIPTLLAFLTGEAMLLQADQPAEMGWAGRHGGTRQDIVILDALRLFPAKRVLLEVQREVGEEADYGVRMVAMRVLARVAGPGAFDVWEHTVSGIEPLLLMRVQQDSPIRDALEFILESDRSAYRDLKDAVPALHPPLWPQIAEAVGGVGGEAGLDVLARLAGRSAEADAAVLEQVGAIAERLYSSSPQGCYSWVRPMLRAEDPRTRSRAIDTLVDLGDADSIHDFVEMLEDPSRRVQAAARQALEELSGRRLGTNRDAWGEWYRRERQWLETDAVTLRQKIDSRDPAEVVAAVGALCQRKVFREEMVEVLAGALWRDEAEVVAATCLALGQLGSKRAAPYLLDALRDSEDLVRDSAWQALKLLTNEDLPSDYEVWARRLRS